MHYIIDTHLDMGVIIKKTMAFDNTQLSPEHCLEKIRIGINSYASPDGIMSMLSDLTWTITDDIPTHDSLVKVWISVVAKLYYYVLQEDMQLPITHLILENQDIRIITEG